MYIMLSIIIDPSSSIEGSTVGIGKLKLLSFYSAVSKSTLMFCFVLSYSAGGSCLYSTGCGGSGCVIDCG